MTASSDFKAFWWPNIAAPEDGRTPVRLGNTPLTLAPGRSQPPSFEAASTPCSGPLAIGGSKMRPLSGQSRRRRGGKSPT